LLIVDGAHNGDSVRRAVTALRDDFGLKNATIVIGTLAGKDVAAMAEAVVPFADAMVVTSWPHARAADPRDIAEHFRGGDAIVTVRDNVADALETAQAHAGERGAVVALGSIAFVASVREYVLGIESDMIRLAATHVSGTAQDASESSRAGLT
jgi:dihydrofolate synthase/folylpolyglutamate synthase